MSNGKLVILSGPSGVGKDTVINEWRRLEPRVQRVVAYTTRAPRTGEIADEDYHFVTQERFQELADGGHFLEHKTVHGNSYATPLTDMEALLREGKIAVLKIDVQGALSVMPKLQDVITVFLLPPSFEELERRIRDRATDDETAIQKRLTNAREEIERASHYQHRIINEKVNEVVQGLLRITGTIME